MEWVDVITISLLPILLVKHEKRNSLIIPLKYLEQNKIKRDVVQKDFVRCSVIWKLICNTKINRGFSDLNSYISLPTNPPTIGSMHSASRRQSNCNTVILCRTSWHTTRVLWADKRGNENYKKESKDFKFVTILAKNLLLENPGIDPGTSRMQSGRSTIWANSPEHVPYRKLMREMTVIE